MINMSYCYIININRSTLVSGQWPMASVSPYLPITHSPTLLFLPPWQYNPESSPGLPFCRIVIGFGYYLTFMHFDNPIGCCKSQTRAVANSFCCKKRFKYFSPVLLFDSGSVIFNSD